MNKLSDIALFNPTRAIKRGMIAPFVEMASLPVNAKFINYIDEKEFSSGSKFKNGDTLFARITPCLENGKTAKVTGLPNETIGHGSTEFIVISAKEPEFDEDYLYYLTRLPEFRIYAQSRMQGTSGRQRVAWQDIAEFEFDFPDQETRKKVGKYLSALDDKIHLNTQINQTLESMAQAIFKSWFVDFDPVHAKANALADGASDEQAILSAMSVISGKSADELITMNRQNPEHYQKLWEIANAFPNGFDGEVPLGWESVALSKICSMQNGYAFKSSDWRDEGIPVIKIGSIQSNIVTVEGNGFVENKFLQEKQDFILRGGDIVIALTGAYVGKAGIIPKNKIAMMNQRVAKFIPNQILNNLPYHSYVYYISQQKDLQDYIDYTAKGSAQPNISTTEILKYQIILADTDIHIHFEKVIQPFLDAILENSVENETLSQIRDELLPKLLSGEIEL